MDDLNKKYLIDLHQHQNSSIEVFVKYRGNEVPIVDRLTLDLIKQLIRMNNVKNIKIRTAIGYHYYAIRFYILMTFMSQR